MSKQELMDKAREFAAYAEKNYSNCAQCVLGAVKHALGEDGPITDDIFKAATGFAGGVGRSGSACGAVTGAVLAVSAYTGRDWADFKDKSKGGAAYTLSGEVVARFRDEYGSQECRGIHQKLFGRSFNIADPEEFKAFVDAGGYKDENCPRVCGDGAAWAVEALYDEGYIK